MCKIWEEINGERQDPPWIRHDPMVIGIDARAATEVEAGRGRVVRELLEGLARLEDRHDYLLYCRRPLPELKLDSRFRWEQVEARDPIWHLRSARSANDRCDVFFSTNSYLTPWFTRIPTVVLVDDLITFVREAKAQRRAKLIERFTIQRAIRRASHLVCISETTRRDLVERFPAARGKCSAVPLCAAPIFAALRPEQELAQVTQRHRLEKPFVLSSGTLEPRKNLPRLIEAYERLPEELRHRYQLVIVGPDGWQMEESLKAANGNAENIRLLGYVSEEDLAALYRLCTVFCYPSLYEGFGLPLLEALQSGAPAITSSVSSLPEVAGPAARYVNPRETGEISAALVELLESPGKREELGKRALDRAREFSWDRTASAVLDRLADAQA
jgi:glycosyltransferase involved in cell wall biosynthesis